MPLREEDGDHIVASPKLSDAVADGFNCAGRVGHQHTAVGRGDRALGNQQVMEVQRGRMQCDADLPRPRLAGIWDIAKLELVEPTWGPHHDGPKLCHGSSNFAAVYGTRWAAYVSGTQCTNS